ncbi:MAG: CHASE2 domain-containing protein [Pseudomonadota bacterium]
MTGGGGPGFRARLLLALALGLVVAGLAQLPGAGAWLQRQEALSLDWRFRLRGSEPPPTELVLVQLGEATIEAAGGWPLDRAIWARLIDTLAEAGARTVVLDALFEPRTPATAADAALAAAIERHGRVVTAVAIAASDHRFSLITPAPAIAAAAAGLGHTALGLGIEGRLRGLPAFVPVGERLVPALALEALRVHRGLRPGDLTDDARVAARLGGEVVAPASRRQFLLRPYGPAGTIPTIEVGDLLAGRAREGLRGALVVVGADAVAIGERFRSAFDVSLSGGEALATAVGNLLEGRTLRMVPGAGAGLTVLAALVGTLLLGRWSALVSLATLFALVSLLLASAQVLFQRHDVSLPLAAPLLALALAALAVEAMRLVAVQRAERELALQRANLGRFFTPAVADRLARTADVAELDRAVEATVLFVDLVGFSAFAERVAPAVAMAELRRTMARVEAEVFAAGGTLVTFLGDGALACFGVPEPSDDAPLRALRSARRLAEGHDGALPISLGLHHGPLLMGNGGGTRQFQFTVIGDTVNVASRIEELTRRLEAAILCSAAVIERARAIDGDAVAGFLPVEPMTLRGRTAPIALYALPRRAVVEEGGGT